MVQGLDSRVSESDVEVEMSTEEDEEWSEGECNDCYLHNGSKVVLVSSMSRTALCHHSTTHSHRGSMTNAKAGTLWVHFWDNTFCDGRRRGREVRHRWRWGRQVVRGGAFAVSL